MEENIIASERLPFRFGNYCDTFIGFHRELGSELTFCSCQQDAIQKHIEMCRIHEQANALRERLPWFINAHHAYPGALWKAASSIFSERVPLHVLPKFMRFADGICHRCNQRVPYGFYAFSDNASGFFISHFRPYVNQACYAAGITPQGHVVLPDVCPEWMKTLDQRTRADAVEAQVRGAFGFPPRGINRNQESKLWLLVRQVLPECSVIRHYRPPWLEGLELDIFIEQHNIGIEFQGRQHSEAFDYLGGERALKKTQRRDKRKVRLCRQAGVRLLFFEEGDDLSENSVRAKLMDVLPDLPIPERMRVERPPFCFFVPCEGGKLRFDNHYERNELSVSGEIHGADFYASGSAFALFLQCEGETVTRLTVRFHPRGSSSKLNVAIPAHEQSVRFTPTVERPMVEMFKVWAMFDPRVELREVAQAADPSQEHGLFTVKITT